MKGNNFLIGNGELLTSPVTVSLGYSEKNYPYSLQESIKRLTTQFTDCIGKLDKLPEHARPGGFAVQLFTLNPDFLAKSYFPSSLLRGLDLYAIGSRGRHITAEKRGTTSANKEGITTEIYVAGSMDAFRSIPNKINAFLEESAEADDLRKIEEINIPFPIQQSIFEIPKESNAYFEVALNLLEQGSGNLDLRSSFLNYAKDCSIQLYTSHAFRTGNLWFVPAYGQRKNIEILAKFAFIRTIRLVPKFRDFGKSFDVNSGSKGIILPDGPPITNDISVAILDGGLPAEHQIGNWLVAYHKLDEEAEDIYMATKHGLGVSSAFLFGPLNSNVIAPRPWAPISHFRIYDSNTVQENPLELYSTLGFIEQVLMAKSYEFINLSIGPDLPICDQDVHAWTSVIDGLLSDGLTFMTIAAGNNGEADRSTGNARVQVPSDCVNALAIGSANNDSADWTRASYSALGPGRLPGIVKPDLLAFGGSEESFFHVLAENRNNTVEPKCGTSYAAPNVLRTAVAVRASLGKESLSLLGIKALLIHKADQKELDTSEVGWGKIPSEIEDIILTPNQTTSIVYQGELEPAKYLRAQIPFPKQTIPGKVTITATICYATKVDPEHSDAYTRAGLSVIFRPHKDKIKSEDSKHPLSRSFFSSNRYLCEEQLRSDVGKWETVLKAKTTLLASSLKEPCFDIHYNARAFGGLSSTRDQIRYAIIISLETTRDVDLTQMILDEYPVLVPIEPKLHIPVSASRVSIK